MADIQINIPSPKGVILKTKGYYCEDDIRCIPETEELNVTANGEYLPTGAGYNKVTVNVEANDDTLDKLIDGSITDLVSNAKVIRQSATKNLRALVHATFPEAEYVKSYAFEGLPNLKTLNLPKCIDVEDRSINVCQALETLNLPCCQETHGNLISRADNLKRLELPMLTAADTYSLEYLRKLEFLYLPKVSKSTFHSFSYLCSLVVFLLGTELSEVSTCNDVSIYKCYHIEGTVDATYNPTGAKDGYIYVPRMLVADYRVAQYWRDVASQIMPYVATFAELTSVDGTTYDKAYVGETQKEYTYDGTEWKEYIR